MKNYEIQLISTTAVARDTAEWSFTRPEGFEFKAGQYINLKLPQLLYEDNKGPRRMFSLSSSPHDKILKITTRMTGSGFKKTVKELPRDANLEITGPMGDLVYRPDSPAVFIAGGIGVTPFMSIVSELIGKKLFNKPVVLLNSSRIQADTPFFHWFSAINEPAFTYIPVMTRDDQWQGENRRFDEQMVKDHVKDIKKPLYYLSGTPGMVREVEGMLKLMNIDPEQIISEMFYGYE